MIISSASCKYSQNLITIDKTFEKQPRHGQSKQIIEVEAEKTGKICCKMKLEEFRGPRIVSNYAKIELLFIPNSSGCAKFFLSEKYNGALWQSKIHPGNDTIKCGIAEEFSSGICKGVGIYKVDRTLYSGDYYLLGGAHATAGSSNFSFSMCIYDLLRILTVVESDDEYIWHSAIEALFTQENSNKVKKILEKGWQSD